VQSVYKQSYEKSGNIIYIAIVYYTIKYPKFKALINICKSGAGIGKILFVLPSRIRIEVAINLIYSVGCL